MTWITALSSAILRLFVDDWGYAAAILAWLLLAGFGLRRLGLPSALPPVIVFAGLATILLASAVRQANSRHGR